jgi:hypothetical protein
MSGFLFSPRVPRGSEDAQCVSVTDIGPIHVHKNCDSEIFQYDAARPSILLEPQRLRQSRPLYAVLGWTLARPFHWLGLESAGEAIVARSKQTYPKGPRAGAFLPEYAAFITINFLLLVLAIMLVVDLLQPERMFDPLTLLPLAMVLVNQVTKAFFWTPHMQIFNILIPVASVALYHWMLRREQSPGWRESGLIGFGIGVGALAYGAFAAMAAGAALCLVVRSLRDRNPPERRETAAAKSIVLLAAFMLPAFGWIAYVKLHTGFFYSMELSVNRDMVWPIDAFRLGGPKFLFWRSLVNLVGYGEAMRFVVVFPIVVLGVIAALLARQHRLREAIGANRTMIEAVALYVVPCIVLLYIVGLYYSRLAWSIVPPAAILIGLGTQEVARRTSARGLLLLKAASIAATFAYMTYWYVRPGPWS